ncbi:rRNA maturation RNase YbeY [Mesoplasma melaleucae]|uniref:Endoribonuclease YbeY n=1 Tax=Mesoplasma melaleucae TaxID=81459 RepID=A0A2K8NYX4_9MOLU|nr:rRNA maturation RNase YbeY [Mesoplasma melaleucae]ATZ17941.1 16S rRNA maturation RNase YbeY [Mesoplasma melaleucae]
MVNIDFVNETKLKTKQWETLAQEIITSAAKYLKLKNQFNLSITFLDSERAKQINIEYTNHSYIPDVTSFPIEMSSQEIKALGYQEIGDIFVCIEEAERKSIKYEHTLKEEMGFLFTHGFLHLLGYDHETNEKDEAEMFLIQDDILKLNNINYTIKFTEEDYNEIEEHNEQN